MSINLYKNEGKNTPYALSGNPGNIFFIGLLIGPALVLALSIVYAYIDVYNPFIYLTLIVFAGMLLGLVMIQKLVVKLSKCRSERSSLIYGSAVGLFAVYACWVAFLFVLTRRFNESYSLGYLQLLTNPALVWESMGYLNDVGWFTIFKVRVSGGVLWVIWFIEALGILGAGILGGLGVMHEEVFCEDCNGWADDIDFNLRLAITDKEAVKSMIENNINGLLELPAATDLQSEHIRVNIHHCAGCNKTKTLDVDLLSYTTNDKGETKESSVDFSPVFVISERQFESFKQKRDMTL